MNNQKNNGERQTAIDEATSGSRETAAALALESNHQARFPFPFFLKKFKTVVLTILLVSIISISTFAYLKFFSGSSTQQESFSILEGIHELATLATAEAVVTTIIKEEDHKLFNQEISIKFPGTKRTSLLIVPATVLAGVDLSTVTEENIIIDEDNKKITLTLPHATLIQEPSIQMEKVQTYSEEGIFRSDVNWEEGFDLAAKANNEIKKEAIQLGLLSKAEESAEKVLSQFFQHIGYSIVIEYK